MSRGIQPMKVAPIIRGARYSFLIAGWFYGASKKAVLTKIEAVEKVRREAILREEEKMKSIENRKQTIETLEDIMKQFGYVPEPGWEKSI